MSMLSRTGCAAVLLLILVTSAPALAQPEQAGSAALAEGIVTATAADGTQRALHDGDAVFTGDSVVTGANSYADLELDDGGRILLHPGTQFQIQQYHFDPDAHDLTGNPAADSATVPASGGAQQSQESAIFRLIKGGLRVIDGLIGQANPQNYALQTPVATIGVRGTQYDVRYCENNCQDASENSNAPDNGLYTAVSEGSIAVKNEVGTSVISKGGYGFLASRRLQFRRLRALPRALRHMNLPRNLRARAERMRRLIRQRRLRRWKQRRAQLLQHAKTGASNHAGRHDKKHQRRHRRKYQDQDNNSGG